MFDKTFPTLDCAACILTPKMVEVGQHENIHLLTYAEVKSVKGVPGNYQVTILKKARHVFSRFSSSTSQMLFQERIYSIKGPFL